MLKKLGQYMDRRRWLGVLLLLIAVGMIIMAYHTVSTDQYKLYDRNYDYYLSEAQNCHDLENTDLGSHYAYLAGEWELSARVAGDYLLQHRAGAVSLGVVSLAAIMMGIRLLLPNRKRKT